jgi:hypothetical protein
MGGPPGGGSPASRRAPGGSGAARRGVGTVEETPSPVRCPATSRGAAGGRPGGVAWERTTQVRDRRAQFLRLPPAGCSPAPARADPAAPSRLRTGPARGRARVSACPVERSRVWTMLHASQFAALRGQAGRIAPVCQEDLEHLASANGNHGGVHDGTPGRRSLRGTGARAAVRGRSPRAAPRPHRRGSRRPSSLAVAAERGPRLPERLRVGMWPVDGGATALLMRQLCGRLAARSGPGARSEALRAAQDAVRRWRDADGSRPWRTRRAGRASRSSAIRAGVRPAARGFEPSTTRVASASTPGRERARAATRPERTAATRRSAAISC